MPATTRMNVNALKSTQTLSTEYEYRHVHSPDEWHAALQDFVSPHVLQSWAWGAFKSRWGWSAQRLLLHDKDGRDRPLAAASVLKRRIPRTPYTILYVPRGPIFDVQDAVLLGPIFAQLEQLARREKALFIKVDPEIVLARDIEPESPEPAGVALTTALAERGWRYSSDQIQFRNTVLLDLSRSEETLLAAMKQKTRYNIGLAQRKGVTVRIGDASDFDLIARMYQETAGRDAFAIRPLAYYLDAWQTLFDASMAVPFIAEYEGEPLGQSLLSGPAIEPSICMEPRAILSARGCPTTCCNGKQFAGPGLKDALPMTFGVHPTSLLNPTVYGAYGASKRVFPARL